MTKALHVLLPYQQRWHEDRSRVRVAEKSRRIGFTWSAACEAVLEAATGGSNGCDVWFMSYDKENTEEFIRDCGWWIRALSVMDSELSFVEDEDDVMTYKIHFASGYRIRTIASRPAKLRGKKGHVILDEAAQIVDLDEAIGASMATHMWRDPKSRVDIISTHFGVDNRFNKICEDIRAGRLDYSLHRVTFDDALRDGFYKRVCLKAGLTWSPEAEVQYRAEEIARYPEEWQAQQELFCVPSRSGGTYIPRDLIERQMRPGQVARLTLESGFLHLTEQEKTARVQEWLENEVKPLLDALPKDRPHFLGEDFGRTRDRSVLTPGYLSQELVRKVPFSIELCNVPYDQQRQVTFYVMDRLPKLVKAAFDATGNGGYLAEAALTRYGQSIVERIDLTEKWYNANLPPFKAALEDRLMELVRDADHLVDMSSFKIINGLPKLPNIRTASSGEGPPRHGDSAIAYLLAHHASCLPMGEYKYTPAPRAQPRAAMPDGELRRGFRSHQGGML